MKQFKHVGHALNVFALIGLWAVVANAQGPGPTAQLARKMYSGTAVPNWACSPGPIWRDTYLRTTDNSMYVCSAAPSTWTKVVGGGVPGTVSSVSIVSANGQSGSVGTATTTPAITLNNPTALNATTSITSPIHLSAAANPADSGVLRLGNAELIAWEKFVAGTDWFLGVNASDELESTATVRAPTFIGALTGTASGNLVSGGALGTPSSGVGTNLTGTAAGLTAGNVTTNANLTGHVTSTGNAALLGSFTFAQLNTAISDADVLATNGAGTSLTGIPYAIAGTANQVVASASTGNITLSLPQSVATSSTPQFARLGLGAAADATALFLANGHANLSGSSTLAWSAGFNAVQFGGNGFAFADTTRAAGHQLYLGNNAYYNTGFKYTSTDPASLLYFYDGTFNVQTAPSGTADAAATFTNRLVINATGGVVWSSGIADATGTPGSLCYNTSNFTMLKNNALTCTVSSQLFKRDIRSLPKNVLSAFDRLRPVQFTYRDHPDRLRYGFISEEASAADRKFADGYDANGRNPTSIDQNAILAATVAEVQDLKLRMLKLEAGSKTKDVKIATQQRVINKLRNRR